MKKREQIQSELNKEKAQLNQLLSSDHFTEKDVELLAPRYGLNIRALQRQLNELKTGEDDTVRAQNIQVNQAVQL